MLTLDTRMSNLDTRLSTGQTGVHANISSIDICPVNCEQCYVHLNKRLSIVQVDHGNLRL